jgi:hypothetical protein
MKGENSSGDCEMRNAWIFNRLSIEDVASQRGTQTCSRAAAPAFACTVQPVQVRLAQKPINKLVFPWISDWASVDATLCHAHIL